MKALIAFAAVACALGIALFVLCKLYARERTRRRELEAQNTALQKAYDASRKYAEAKGELHVWKETQTKAARADPSSVVAGILAHNNKLSNASGGSSRASAEAAAAGAGNPKD